MKYNKYIYKIAFVALIALFASNTNAQSKKNATRVPIEFQLVDEKGNPIKNAEIVVGEGSQHLDVDKNGFISFKMDKTESVSIAVNGFEPKSINYTALSTTKKVTLQKSLALASASDVVYLPYSQTTKRAQTGGNIVITGEELRRYPTLDFRNALTALAPGLIVTEKQGATGIFEDKVALSMRSGAPIYFIDDLAIDILEFTIDPLEVESVTIIKDPVEKMMYGPRGANGIVYIKTIRGKVNERKLNVNVEKGVQTVDRMPGVASGADYAKLNNMARIGSGLQPLYTSDAIAAYALNNPNDLKYPSNNFQASMFNNVKSYDKYSVSSLGGNEFAQYNANIAYTGEGDNFAMGDEGNFRNISLRSNVDMKLNDIVSVNMGVFGGLTLRNSPRYAFGDNNESEFIAALGQSRSVSPIAFPAYLPITTATGNPVYGVSNAFTSNPLANLEGGGYHQERGRNGSVHAAINFNLDKTLKGLSVKTYINFTTYNKTRIGKENSYDSRLVVMSPGILIPDTFTYTIKTDYNVPGNESKLTDYYYQNLAGFAQASYNRKFNDHSVSADAVYSLSSFTRKGIRDPYKEQNLSAFGSYSYKNKYYVNAAVSYSGSQALNGENQYKAFPSVGASWIMSDESFMSNISFLNFLKVRAQYGLMGYTNDNPSMRQYENQWLYSTTTTNKTPNYNSTTFGPGTTTAWQGAQGTMNSGNTYYSRWKNQNLDWQTKEELSIGIDALLFDSKLAISANYYNVNHTNIQSTAENLYPLMSGLLANPSINFEANKNYGAELSARYTDNINDFKYSIGASATFNRAVRTAFDEPNYRDSESYLRREGKSTDVIYGYVYEGVYASDAEAQSVKQFTDETLLAGDLKYKDVNEDDVLDAKDQVVIGNSAPKVYYTFNVSLFYKNFELNAIADGKAGFDMVMSGDYFRDGSGDDNYSQYIVDRVNAGNYPRLTYNVISNNFLTSSYWMQKRDYFKLQNIELAYNFRFQAKSKNALRNIKVFARGANLFTISNVKGIDPEDTAAGISAYPLNRTITGGLSLTF